MAATVDVQSDESSGLCSLTEIASVEVPRKRKRNLSRQLQDDLNDEDRQIKVTSLSVERESPKITSKEIESKELSVINNSDSDYLCNDKTVYIEGLPYDSTEADVLSFFESCGHIQSVRLPKWHDSGRLRGYGHVQFSLSEAVTKALDLDGEF